LDPLGERVRELKKAVCGTQPWEDLLG